MAAAVTAIAAPAGHSDGRAVPTPGYDTAAIVLVEAHDVSIHGERYTISTYRNDAYGCGREGTFPFVVVEPVAASGEPRPLWALLHGGGIGYYDVDGSYETTSGESHNDAETTGRLLHMLYRYVGPDGTLDTFVGDRVRAGDRVVLGSLCDHDLYLGLGQPYPNNPNHADTVDGLLANLAMVDAVTNGTESVAVRPTSSRWILGTSAGAFGAYALAHNLWARDVSVSGVILDSGVLTARSAALRDGLPLVTAGMVAKHGPYLTDEALWIDETIANGFDVPLFDTVQQDDRTCAGNATLVAGAEQFASNCAWVHAALHEVIVEHGDPRLQQVRIYPGGVHEATDAPGTPLQADLREWYLRVVVAE
jgi:hypothetical protein